MGWTPPPSIADVTQLAVPANGGTTVVTPGVTLLFLNAAGTVATYTITLPANAVDGQRMTIATASQLSAVTINGATVKGPVTNLTANGFAQFNFSTAAAAWFRTG